MCAAAILFILFICPVKIFQSSRKSVTQGSWYISVHSNANVFIPSEESVMGLILSDANLTLKCVFPGFRNSPSRTALEIILIISYCLSVNIEK